MGGWFGTTGLFLVTPLLGGLALVLLYAWATTVVGPRWAGVATAVAGASMPFMVFARDTYSEPVAMAFVFGGLWLLHVASRSGKAPVWLLAGLPLGGASPARLEIGRASCRERVWQYV